MASVGVLGLLSVFLLVRRAGRLPRVGPPERRVLIVREEGVASASSRMRRAFPIKRSDVMYLASTRHPADHVGMSPGPTVEHRAGGLRVEAW